MSARKRSKTARRVSGETDAALGSYWSATRQPLVCLVFVLPLVLAYEFGVVVAAPSFGPQIELIAERWIRQLVGWLGADAFWVPGVALLVTLLVWHQWRRDPWQVRAWVPAVMAAESLILTLPLFVVGQMLQQTGSSPTVVDPAWRVQIVLALGAGIYEELVFRFYLISGLALLLIRVARMPRVAGTVLAAALATVVFAMCHLAPIGASPFTWPLFLVLAGAGGYLSLVYVARGLGISTGCHVAYNLILLLFLR